MKKTILVALAFISAWPCAAQKNPFKWWKSLRSAPARAAEVTPAYRVVQGKILHSVRPVVPARQLELEKFVARSVNPTPVQDLVFATTPGISQTAAFEQRYLETMEKFKQFKKETDPFLYYRLKEPKNSGLPPQESRLLSPLVANMEKSLLRLGAVIDAKEDEPLAFALEYVARVRDELAPVLKGMSGAAIYFSRADRTFVGNEFYLHEPEFKRWTGMLRRGQAVRQADKLPAGLRVAVLNDRESVLENMTASHKQGVFIRGGKLDCFERADDLISAVRTGRKYDIILTDIIVEGGGGYYLTNVLRIDGYQGAIIALSAFERDDSMGMEMFECGFDGMLNLPIGFEYSPFWAADVMRGLNKYFYLRGLNHWQR